MKTLLVTGAAGFIGSTACHYFKAFGLRVVGVDIGRPPAYLSEGVDRYEQIKLPDEKLGRLLEEEKPDYCVHCAGSSSVGFSVDYPEEDFWSHSLVTYGLLNALRVAAPQCKTIYLSSAAVYGNPEKLPVCEDSPLKPISPYGYHKLNCELICEQFHALYRSLVCSVRIFSAYGDGLRKQLLWDIFKKANSSELLRLHGTGGETRDFIHSSDICRAFTLLFEKGRFDASVYNLGTGRETQVRTVSELMLRYLKREIPTVFNGDVRPGDPRHWRAEISRLESLGYSPDMDFESGLARYVKWCHEQEA